VIFVVALGIYIQLQSHRSTNAPQVQNRNQQQEVQQSSDQFVSQKDLNATGKTYVSEEYGFEFQYPQNWYIAGQYSLVDDSIQLLSNYKNADSFDSGNAPTNLKSIFFEVSAIDANSTLDDLKPQSDSTGQLLKFEKFTTSQGFEGRKAVMHSNDDPAGDHTGIFFIKNGLEVSFFIGLNSEDQISLFGQILSTFKFTK
jgi:hypothetical protein